MLLNAENCIVAIFVQYMSIHYHFAFDIAIYIYSKEHTLYYIKITCTLNSFFCGSSEFILNCNTLLLLIYYTANACLFFCNVCHRLDIMQINVYVVVIILC